MGNIFIYLYDPKFSKHWLDHFQCTSVFFLKFQSCSVFHRLRRLNYVNFLLWMRSQEPCLPSWVLVSRQCFHWFRKKKAAIIILYVSSDRSSKGHVLNKRVLNRTLICMSCLTGVFCYALIWLQSCLTLLLSHVSCFLKLILMSVSS